MLIATLTEKNTAKASKKMGRQSLLLEKKASLNFASTVAGPKEARGPLAQYFDRSYKDILLKEKSFEKAECHMLEEACFLAMGKGGLTPDDIDYFFAGDLLNQVISASYCARKLSIPYFGLYGACSTLTEGLSLGSMLVEGGFASRVLIATSSHNCTSERQYRFPTEYGYQRPGYAQWTVTGAGAVILGSTGHGPKIESLTPGKIVDAGIKDPLNMGTAMAPAAADTIKQHLSDLEREPGYYHLIVTGDLGSTGKKLNEDILLNNGIDIRSNYADCGVLIYHPHQNVGSGGSGCACSALVFLSFFLNQMQKKEIRRVLLVATGSLHSPTTILQGESMPSIAHAVSLEI